MISIVIIISLLLLCASYVAAFCLRPCPLRYVRSLTLYSSSNKKEGYNNYISEFWSCVQAIREYNPDKEESYFKANIIELLLSHRDEAFDLLDEACVLIDKTESDTIMVLTNDIDRAIDQYNKINSIYGTLRSITPIDDHTLNSLNRLYAAAKDQHTSVGGNLNNSKYQARVSIRNTLANKEMLLSKKLMISENDLPLSFSITINPTAPAVLPIEAVFDSDSVGGGGGEVDDYIGERIGER